MKRTRGLFVSAIVAALSSVSCAAAPAEEIGQTAGAVVGTDTFLYFRSNATGWGVDDSTRLLSFPAPNVFGRRYFGVQLWMITDADTAILTETNQLNGWGTVQTFSGAASKSIVVPGTDALAVQPPGGDAHFRVKYHFSGEHRVLVNLGASPATISIESVIDVCAGVSCPNRTHCELLPNGQPTCALDPGPICGGGVRCPNGTICCNIATSCPICFGGSGACPPPTCP
jgi:hypothetical protein